ncbi:ABC transporter substrate-binding protein, partial [Fictibacillus sp. NRS-1165]|uniref:ABC transporter substrate-binding protein n=1 Tax=Fictibacillus sp. NRS-1165 TaxID=3144463 RepID=UPI003D1F069A
MLKRGISFVIFLVLAVALTACSSSKQTGGSGKTTIEFLHSSVEQERIAVLDKLIAKFEKENPNIKVKQVPIEEDKINTKIITLANSGKLPAVVEAGQDYAKVMDKDQLIDKGAVKKIIDEVGEKNYYEGALNLMRTENSKSFTGVPMS